MASNVIAAEHRAGLNLKQADIDRFCQQGVPPLALARNRIGLFDFVLLDDVVFLPENSFEFHRHMPAEKGEIVCTLLVRDVCGDLIDIVAWQPNTGRIASWLGRAALIGAEQLYGPRLAPALSVHPDPLSWLKSFRDGVVVVDGKRAAAWLRDAGPLVVASVEHGRHLKHLLTIPTPRILVASSEGIAA